MKIKRKVKSKKNETKLVKQLDEMITEDFYERFFNSVARNIIPVILKKVKDEIDYWINEMELDNFNFDDTKKELLEKMKSVKYIK